MFLHLAGVVDMTVYNCFVSVCTVYFSFICATAAQGENTKNNQNKTDTYQFFKISDFDEHSVLKDAYIDEFNLIMKIKNDRIKKLFEEIALKNKIIRSNNNQDESEYDLYYETQNELENENLLPSELKNFVKEKIRSVFKKEFSEIIQEKSVQIDLLEKLLEAKKKTIKLQKELKEGIRPLHGMREPSTDYDY